jgi:hypothetical protein
MKNDCVSKELCVSQSVSDYYMKKNTDNFLIDVRLEKAGSIWPLNSLKDIFLPNRDV